MRFLGVGDAADLASLYLRLVEEGHEVKVFVGHPLCEDTLAGLVERVRDWRAELDWVREAEDDGCILFENASAGLGDIQDGLRRDGFNVIGGSAYGERLELDRAFAQQELANVGLQTARSFQFSDAAEAASFIRSRPCRYVLKPNGVEAWTFIGELPSGEDVVALLAAGAMTKADGFILMEHLEGVEMGVGAYFNGETFLAPACLDWEHKRFFDGDLGELTGEMGTVVTYERSKRFFHRTLGKMEPLLRQHGYCGYINLNTMVNEAGIWPLEFTCRFGYPGYAILQPLQRTPWGELFARMLSRSSVAFDTELGYCAGIVITTPPFPYSREELSVPINLPVLFDGELSPEERRHVHYGEVGLKEGVLVTTGANGYTAVVTGTGQSVHQARDRALALARRVRVTNARYRRDIGQKLIDGDLARVEGLGLLGD